MGKVNGQRQYQAPDIPVEQALLLIIEKQKGSTQDKLRQKGEVKTDFSYSRISQNFKELKAPEVRSTVCQQQNGGWRVGETANTFQLPRKDTSFTSLKRCCSPKISSSKKLKKCSEQQKKKVEQWVV